MNQSRFSPPSAADELCRCDTCREQFHYENLDEDFNCQANDKLSESAQKTNDDEKQKD